MNDYVQFVTDKTANEEKALRSSASLGHSSSFISLITYNTKCLLSPLDDESFCEHVEKMMSGAVNS